MTTPLDRARRKAYWRLLPLCFICYVIAYVDRANVAIAKLTMTKDLAGFDNAVIGFGAGVFFIGYFLLEIPGTLIIERWSARKWLARIMVSWGLMAALTAAVQSPWHFYIVRFLLGLAEAGFFPGVIVYLTHWFPARDRARALAYFLVATPMAQIVSPKISSALLVIGTDETLRTGQVIHHPHVWGLAGWQWVYIAWGIPAVVLGVIVFFALTDYPRQATWLSEEEREALQTEIDREQQRVAAKRLTLFDALRQPKVLLLALAYFLVVTGNYGIEFFLPSILERWYGLHLSTLTWLVMLPPALALVGQLALGWNSDRTGERLWHTVVPMVCGAIGLAAAVWSRGSLPLTVLCFMLAAGGLKAYLPSFWSLPSLFLTGSAAAGSIGLINSIGNLGGFLGPFLVGSVEAMTGSFESGLLFLGLSAAGGGLTIFLLGIGGREAPDSAMRRPLAAHPSPEMRSILILLCASGMLLGSGALVGSQRAPIRLVVQADDLGAAHGINVASLQAYTQGIVRSVNVIVPAPWTPEAIALLRQHPDLDAGVHLAITSEWSNVKWRPLTSAPTLVDARGYFFPMVWPNDKLPAGSSLKENAPALAEIERELRAQIEFARREISQLNYRQLLSDRRQP